jgi:hypothetical protein
MHEPNENKTYRSAQDMGRAVGSGIDNTIADLVFNQIPRGRKTDIPVSILAPVRLQSAQNGTKKQTRQDIGLMSLLLQTGGEE